RIKEFTPTITDAISQSVAHTALALDVAAIVAPTESGYTAKMISKYRPKSPIVAVTSDEQVGRRLALVWGVQAFMAEKRAASTDEMLDTAIQTGMDAGLIGLGDTVVITAGVPVAETG
ncbi:pyruvate kinase, partial [Vibrio cholerae]|nr:pyruvate kinase [Vibrio cholerae]